ncbi:MAG: PIN domain-containing protein [Thermoguttaceae bacterium]
MAEPLVIDANPIISALLGDTARELLFSHKFLFFSTQHTLFEVEKYLPNLAKRLDRPEEELYREFQLLSITVCQANEYDAHIKRANDLIGGRDAKDIPILALTLCLGCPLWTEDRDFDNLSDILVRHTADLIG